MMPFVSWKMDGGTQTVNPVLEVGGYGNKWDPWRCGCWWWGSPLLTEMVPKPPPFFLSLLMGILCSSAESVTLFWAQPTTDWLSMFTKGSVIMLRRYFMSVFWKKWNNGNCKSSLFLASEFSCFAWTIGNSVYAYDHPYLMSTFDLPSFSTIYPGARGQGVAWKCFLRMPLEC